MHNLLLLLVTVAACIVFGAIAATVCAIFQLALAGLEALVSRRRRRRAARRPQTFSGRR